MYILSLSLSLALSLSLSPFSYIMLNPNISKFHLPQVLVSALRLHTAERVLSACLATLHSLTAERGTATAFGFVVLAPKTPRECGLGYGDGDEWKKIYDYLWVLYGLMLW